jgi:hypothetical protein
MAEPVEQNNKKKLLFTHRSGESPAFLSLAYIQTNNLCVCFFRTYFAENVTMRKLAQCCDENYGAC